jgi:hypothetical protein
MTAAHALTLRREGFFAPVAATPREDLLLAYRNFLDERNGALDAQGRFARREAWLAESRGWRVRHRGELDPAVFGRQYARFDPSEALSPEALALLAFVKVNAGEAYGVETSRRLRSTFAAPPSDLFSQIEHTLMAEEDYHTKILVGATQHFGVAVEGAWRPPLSLRLLIGVLIYAPKGLYHPAVLASELGGIYGFQWMLRRVGQVFRDEPELRDAMEQRLIEILIDEVGHVAFNRMAVGPLGLAVARPIARLVLRSALHISPELAALGLGDEEIRGLDAFDYQDLPEEVRRRAFFA